MCGTHTLNKIPKLIYKEEITSLKFEILWISKCIIPITRTSTWANISISKTFTMLVRFQFTFWLYIKTIQNVIESHFSTGYYKNATYQTSRRAHFLVNVSQPLIAGFFRCKRCIQCYRGWDLHSRIHFVLSFTVSMASTISNIFHTYIFSFKTIIFFFLMWHFKRYGSGISILFSTIWPRVSE